MTPDSINVEHQALVDSTALLTEWAELESRADNRFFLSSSWIGCWLEAYHPKVNVLRARSGEQTVGLALFTVRRSWRHGFVMPRTLRLHQTGIDALDQIWVEYNDFLLDACAEDVIASAMQRYLIDCYPGWDEWSTGAITKGSSLQRVAEEFYAKKVWYSRYYGVDLDRARVEHPDYRSSLSRNTRYQINRTEKVYRERGSLVCERATSLEQARQFFEGAGPLHASRWAVEGTSGFNNPSFVQFHLALIEKAWPQGQIELLRVSVDDHPVAYLYNFIYRNKVYFYLSGLQFEDDNRLKPGLLAHALCIEQHWQEGRQYYDFMGGDMRYKKSLANCEGDIAMYAYQKPRAALLIERVARYFKHRQWRQ